MRQSHFRRKGVRLSGPWRAQLSLGDRAREKVTLGARVRGKVTLGARVLDFWARSSIRGAFRP